MDDIVNDNGGTDVISLTGNNGRYVRIICTERVVIGGAQWLVCRDGGYGSASPSSALLQDITIDGVSLPTFSGNTFTMFKIVDSLVIPVVDAVPANPSATILLQMQRPSGRNYYRSYFGGYVLNGNLHHLLSAEPIQHGWQDEFDYLGQSILQNGIIRPFHRLTEVGLMVKSNITPIEMRILM